LNSSKSTDKNRTDIKKNDFRLSAIPDANYSLVHSGRVHSNCASPPLREKLMYEHYTLDGCPPNRKSGAPPLNADMVSVANVENHDSKKNVISMQPLILRQYMHWRKIERLSCTNYGHLPDASIGTYSVATMLVRLCAKN